MVRSAWMLMGMMAAAAAGVALGAAPGGGADPLIESRNIQAEMDALAKAPEVKRVLALEDKQGALYQESDKQQQALREELSRAEDTPAWAQYVAKRDALEQQREEVWAKERRAMAAAAKDIYEARHKELTARGAGDLPMGRALGLEPLTFPRVDGSTSTHPLAVIVTARLLGLSYAWDYPEPTGTPYMSSVHWMPEGMRWATGYSMSGDEDFTLVASRVRAIGNDLRGERAAALVNNVLAANSATHDAWEHLIAGTCDVNLTARPPSESERKLAAERHVEVELVPIARDALVFIVNRDNPVSGLTLDQVRAIYTGKATTWKAVDGGNVRGAADEKIVPLSRERDSGSEELFDALVTSPQPPEKGAGQVVQGSMSGPFNRLTTERAGLAYSVYYFERFMAMSPYTKTIAIDGVAPTAENLRSGKYPLVAPIYAALRKDAPADGAARKLVRYLQSEEGQKLLEEAGYVGAAPGVSGR